MADDKKKTIEGEIVTPEMLDRVLGNSQVPEFTNLDALMARFEHLLRTTPELVRMDKPESWLGEFFGGVDYRIAIKTERAQAILGLFDAFMETLDRVEKVEEKFRLIFRQQYERYIDRLRYAKIALEEEQNLKAVIANFHRQQMIEDAKAEVEVSKCKKEIRDASREHLPAPPVAPPSAPKPSAEDVRVKKKIQLQQILERLKEDEAHDITWLTHRKPEAEWNADDQEEVKRIKNMYFHRREKIRNELREYL